MCILTSYFQVLSSVQVKPTVVNAAAPIPQPVQQLNQAVTAASMQQSQPVAVPVQPTVISTAALPTSISGIPVTATAPPTVANPVTGGVAPPMMIPPAHHTPSTMNTFSQGPAQLSNFV